MSVISPEMKGKFDVLVGYYPPDQRQAAVIPLLHLMQDASSGNYLTVEAQEAVADYLQMPISKVHEVVSFYTMLSDTPRGKNHVMVCHTLPCALMGCASVSEAITGKLHIHDGEMTPDGKFSLIEVECLARCGEGPVMQVGETLYTHLNAESTVKILDDLAKRG